MWQFLSCLLFHQYVKSLKIVYASSQSKWVVKGGKEGEGRRGKLKRKRKQERDKSPYLRHDSPLEPVRLGGVWVLTFAVDVCFFCFLVFCFFFVFSGHFRTRNSTFSLSRIQTNKIITAFIVLVLLAIIGVIIYLAVAK